MLLSDSRIQLLLQGEGGGKKFRPIVVQFMFAPKIIELQDSSILALIIIPRCCLQGQLCGLCLWF